MRVSVLLGIAFPSYWKRQPRRTSITPYSLTNWIDYLLQPRLILKQRIIFCLPPQFLHIQILASNYDMFGWSIYLGMCRLSLACYASIFACWRLVVVHDRLGRTVSEGATRASGASHTRFTGHWRRVIVRKLDVVPNDCIKKL